MSRIFCAFLFLCLAIPVAFAATVSGTITDSNGVPIKSIAVHLFQLTGDPETGPSYLGTFITNGAGVYTSSALTDTSSTYIDVDWKFDTAIPTFPQNAIIFEGIRATDGGTGISPNGEYEYKHKQSSPLGSNLGNTNVTINLSMDDPFGPQFAFIIMHVQQCVSMFMVRSGPNWRIDYDIPTWATTRTNTNFHNPDDHSINILSNLLTSGAPSHVYHEMGHLIQGRIYFLNSPGGTHYLDTVLGVNPNDLFSEKEAGRLALSEGWGDYTGAMGNHDYPVSVDNFYARYIEGNPFVAKIHVWRGLSAQIIYPLPNDGSDNNGERIENNIASILDIAPSYTFRDYIRVFQDAHPQDFHDFNDGILDLKQANSSRDTWMTFIERLGIVYTRAKFDANGSPFVEKFPVGITEEPGNAGVLHGVWHVRGKVNSDLAIKSKLELNSLYINEAFSARLLIKRAIDGTMESAVGNTPLSTVFPFTSSLLGSRFFGGLSVVRERWITKKVPDGEYDIVAQMSSGRNGLHWDSLFPTFLGDANGAGDNTDEKWLKSDKMGTWFAAGFVRTDNAAGNDAGRVNVDNTPPRIQQLTIFPPPN